MSVCQSPVNLSAETLFLVASSSTRQLINSSTHQLVNSSTCQLINSSTRQLINSSTRQLINSLTHQLINSLTHQLINSSTHQLINLSTHQLINSSTYQLKNRLPRCKISRCRLQPVCKVRCWKEWIQERRVEGGARSPVARAVNFSCSDSM